MCTFPVYLQGEAETLIFWDFFLHQSLREGMVPRRGLGLMLQKSSKNSYIASRRRGRV
jgi:hypothetical protein